MADEAVRVTRRGNVMTAMIDREERRNAINDAVVAGISAAIKTAEADPAVRALVLTGCGHKAFCAGADLSARAKSIFDAAQGRLPFAALLEQARNTDVPIVGRINGHCLAGGMGLLSICDMAVAVDNARFGLPEVRVGLFPMQVISVIRDLVPPRKLRELALTGEPINAAQALEFGLVNYVVPLADLDAKVDWLVGRLLDKSPSAVRLGKRSMRITEGMSFAEALAYLEAQITMMAQTPDAIEGRAAFNEKRTPKWAGDGSA